MYECLDLDVCKNDSFQIPNLLICVIEDEEDQAQRTSLEAGKSNPVKQMRQIVTAY